ncbi:MAG: cobalt transporter CbiM [Caldiserica bacterium]|nr:cobalt transporter CbiM [Caldisericota bacterium]
MHISEGILSAPVLLSGAGVTIIGTALGLRGMKEEKIPRTALLSSAFFVASLVHVPVGPSSAHLILNGLVGILLGWAAFPAILLGLTLQAALFQFGGLTTLGVNTMNMALPAVICYFLFHLLVKKKSTALTGIAGFLAGFLGVLLSGLMVALSLVFTGEYFRQVAKLVIIVHLPIMFIEGVITGFIVVFLRKVKPEILEG